MNTQLNDDFVNLAKELFEDLTQVATFKQITGGGMNFTTGMFEGDVVVDIPIYCRKSFPTKEEYEGNLDLGLTISQIVMIITAGIYFKSNKPLINDKIVIGNNTYTIKRIQSVDAVYEVAMYKFACGIA